MSRPGGSTPLRAYFDAYREGPGIFKWTHYFNIYDRHFRKFVGREVNVLEIGVYSGGSLGMWRDYFGPRCQIFGIDIEPSCRSYESESVRVFIGDQADRAFWRRFRTEAPPIDIVIDDGGHRPWQQIVTLEETLPYLRPGGVYLCEDVHGVDHKFSQYISGFAFNLNADAGRHNEDDAERVIAVEATAFQSSVRSVHIYPYVVVVERSDGPVDEFVAAKHGTQWQPFLDG